MRRLLSPQIHGSPKAAKVLKKGDFEKTLVPPFLRGARGDLRLIVKQESVIGFDVKLTPMDTALSCPLCHSDATGIDITSKDYLLVAKSIGQPAQFPIPHAQFPMPIKKPGIDIPSSKHNTLSF